LEAALFEQSNIILICKIWHFLNNFFLISQIRLQLREEEEETPLYTNNLQAHLVQKSFFLKKNSRRFLFPLTIICSWNLFG
jgi:hypothetical protein